MESSKEKLNAHLMENQSLIKQKYNDFMQKKEISSKWKFFYFNSNKLHLSNGMMFNNKSHQINTRDDCHQFFLTNLSFFLSLCDHLSIENNNNNNNHHHHHSNDDDDDDDDDGSLWDITLRIFRKNICKKTFSQYSSTSDFLSFLYPFHTTCRCQGLWTTTCRYISQHSSIQHILPSLSVALSFLRSSPSSVVVLWQTTNEKNR